MATELLFDHPTRSPPIITPALEQRLLLTSVFLSTLFTCSGLSKLLGWQLQEELFRQFGFASWFVPVVGALELGFAALALTPKTRAYGALGFLMLLVGAALTHVMTGVLLPFLLVHAGLIAASIFIVLKQRPKFLRVW
jgi:uncharacterized membrane protein YphA (DoxX/SURF4 family)